mgnify:CR=1 FL=1
MKAENSDYGTPRILVVDDEENVGLSLLDNLQLEGLSAVLATTAHQAMELLDETPIDLAILDLFMPELSGIELGQRLRENKPDLALVILTGHPSVDSCRDSFLAGATNFIVKGEPIERLLKVIVEALYPISSDTTLAIHAQRLGLPTNRLEHRLLEPLTRPLESYKQLAIEYYLTNLATLCEFCPHAMASMAGCSIASMYRLMSKYKLPTPRNTPLKQLDA